MATKTKGRLFIPLYRKLLLPVVRQFLMNNVSQLATHFMSDGYVKGYGFFYVALEDNQGHTNDVTPSVVVKWSTEWKEVNDEFEKKLLVDDELKVFSNKMLMVWDGNHRLQAWMPIIEQCHTHFSLNLAQTSSFMCGKWSIDVEIEKVQNCKDNDLIERDVTFRNIDK